MRPNQIPLSEEDSASQLSDSAFLQRYKLDQQKKQLGYVFQDGHFFCIICPEKSFRKQTEKQIKRHLREAHQKRFQRQNNGKSVCPIPDCARSMHKGQLRKHLIQHKIQLSGKTCRDVRKEYRFMTCIFCQSNVVVKDAVQHYRQKHEINTQNWQSLHEQWNKFRQSQSVLNKATLNLQQTFRLRKNGSLEKVVIKQMVAKSELQYLTQNTYNLDTNGRMLVLGLKNVFDIHQNWRQEPFFQILTDLLKEISVFCSFGNSKKEIKENAKFLINEFKLSKMVKTFLQRDYYWNEQIQHQITIEKGFHSKMEDRFGPSQDLYKYYRQVSLFSVYRDWQDKMIQKRDYHQRIYQNKVKQIMSHMRSVEIIYVKERGAPKQRISPKQYKMRKKEKFQKALNVDTETFSSVWMKTPAETRAFNSLFLSKKEKKNNEFDFDAYNLAEERKRKQMLAKQSGQVPIQKIKAKHGTDRIIGRSAEKISKINDHIKSDSKSTVSRKTMSSQKYEMSNFLKMHIDQNRFEVEAPKMNVFPEQIEYDSPCIATPQKNDLPQKKPSEMCLESSAPCISTPQKNDLSLKKASEMCLESSDSQSEEISAFDRIKLKKYPNLAFLSFNPYFLKRIINAPNPEDAFIFNEKKIRIKKKINELTKRPIKFFYGSERMRPFSKQILKKIGEIQITGWAKQNKMGFEKK